LQPTRSGMKSLRIDIDRELAKLALFIAETWRDEHPDASATSLSDFKECVAYVTAEMVTAGSAVGGPIGLEITTGGGSKAACKVCEEILATRLSSSGTTNYCCQHLQS
jgi:hypothetical protein